MSRLRSPNVVSFVESGLSKENDVYWLVMELLEAESLDRILDHEGPISELEVIKVFELRLLKQKDQLNTFWNCDALKLNLLARTSACKHKRNMSCRFTDALKIKHLNEAENVDQRWLLLTTQI
jgi:serine/threonine protein kinase